MNKLDDKLVAYLEEILPKEEKQLQALERLQNNCLPIGREIMEEGFHQEQLQLFKSISAIRLSMEAVTLQPEGTKRMELLQSEIRPIFTVECQLSHELIKRMPRYDMFHIMQFESEKFQSLTQCTRFGQEAQRDVSLALDEDEDVINGNGLNFGRIHFTVWWREPGTCLNEMLGMGVLELQELYNASLLEQCKCITINRRGMHLASLYFKISLQINRSETAKVQNGQVKLLEQLLDVTSLKQCSGANGSDQKQVNSAQKSNESAAQNGSGKAASHGASSGEYAESFLYLKDTEIQ